MTRGEVAELGSVDQEVGLHGAPVGGQGHGLGAAGGGVEDQVADVQTEGEGALAAGAEGEAVEVAALEDEVVAGGRVEVRGAADLEVVAALRGIALGNGGGGAVHQVVVAGEVGRLEAVVGDGAGDLARGGDRSGGAGLEGEIVEVQAARGELVVEQVGLEGEGGGLGVGPGEEVAGDGGPLGGGGEAEAGGGAAAVGDARRVGLRPAYRGDGARREAVGEGEAMPGPGGERPWELDCGGGGVELRGERELEAAGSLGAGGGLQGNAGGESPGGEVDAGGKEAEGTSIGAAEARREEERRNSRLSAISLIMVGHPQPWAGCLRAPPADGRRARIRPLRRAMARLGRSAWRSCRRRARWPSGSRFPSDRSGRCGGLPGRWRCRRRCGPWWSRRR